MSKEIDEVLKRLKIIFNVNSDTALAKSLKKPLSTVSNWRQRNSVPYDLCVEIAERDGYSLDWLLMGKGDMHSGNGAGEQKIVRANDTKKMEGTLQAMVEFLQFTWTQADAREKVWLEVQFEKCFTEFQAQAKNEKKTAG